MIGVALAACSSSTHLDPPGASATGAGGGTATTTSTATTGTGSGGGGGAPTQACRSNPECSTFPNTVCDTVSGECHECLLDSDCALKGGPVCVSGKCGCPVKGETFCGDPGVGHCADKMTAQTDCGTCAHACFGACAAGVCADPWEPTSLVGAPDARSHHVAVWDVKDSAMIVWGGRTANGSTATGGVYDLAKNTWKPTSMANAPTARVDATAVWDETEKAMIVWGGRAALGGGPALSTGALYYPAKNVWKTIATDVSAPAARWGHSAVWTDSKMLVWGGENASGQLGDGGTFDPSATGGWTPIAAGVGSPTPRTLHTAVWTGATTNSMLVWGGYGPDPVMAPTYFRDGAVYDIQGAAWGPINVGVLAPSARAQATAVWTGTNMLVWGGTDGAYLGDGARYANGAWFALSNTGAPSARAGHSAAWMTTSAGPRMIVWGGMNSSTYLDSGALLDETSVGWSPALPTAPIARAHHSTVINGNLGSKMIIWGGDVGPLNSGEVTATGAIFDASAPM